MLALLLDLGADEQPIRALEIDDWPRSGLPWIAFWLKELITWGTLDPVAAVLLARGDAIDRPQAELDAAGPPQRSVAPAATASSTSSLTVSNCSRETIGPISVSQLNGSPIRSLRAPATTPAMKRSETSRMT